MKVNPKIRIKVPGFISSRQNAWFFQRLGEPVEFRADQLIAVPGMYPRYSYFLKTGRVIAGIVNSANNQRLMLSFEEDSLLLEQYQLTGKPCDLYYRAVTDCTAQMISYHDITQAMKADFSVTLDILGAISDLGAMSLQQRMFENASDATEKVCGQFLDFALAFGEEEGGGVVITERLTQEKIGALSGLHRVTVSRELKKLRDRGLIRLQDGLYHIPNLNELINYCDNHEEAGGLRPAPLHLFCHMLTYFIRCLSISYMSTAAAVEALSELTRPRSGMLTRKSQRSRTSRPSPSPSEPMTSAMGPVSSVCHIPELPSAAAP